MAPGWALLTAAILTTLVAPVMPKPKLTKGSLQKIEELRKTLDSFVLMLDDLDDTLQEQMDEKGVTLPPPTVPPTTRAAVATIKTTASTMKAMTTTIKAVETTIKTTETTIGQTVGTVQAPTDAPKTTISGAKSTIQTTGASIQTTGATVQATKGTVQATEATNAATKASSEQSSTGAKESSHSQETETYETAQATPTTLPQRTTKYYHTIPPVVKHPGIIYHPDPEAPDRKCYCEEIPEDESMYSGSGQYSHGSGDTSGDHGGGGKSGGTESDTGNKTATGGSGTQGGGGGSDTQGGGGGNDIQDQTGGGGGGEGGGGDDGEQVVSRGPAYCFPNLKNQAAYEGTPSIPMNVTQGQCSVAWTAIPTSDELNQYQILDSSCTAELALTELYSISGSGLTILNSTTTEGGKAISTAGLYLADCNDSGERTAAKFIVVRGRPQCSCINDISSSDVELTCEVFYADGAIHPIPAIMTWIVDGELYQTDTPYRDKTDMYVYTARSVIVISRPTGEINNYQCLVTFGEPTDLQYDFIATNAPEYSEYCSSSCVDGRIGSGDEDGEGGGGDEDGEEGGGDEDGDGGGGDEDGDGGGGDEDGDGGGGDEDGDGGGKGTGDSGQSDGKGNNSGEKDGGKGTGDSGQSDGKGKNSGEKDGGKGTGNSEKSDGKGNNSGEKDGGKGTGDSGQSDGKGKNSGEMDGGKGTGGKGKESGGNDGGKGTGNSGKTDGKGKETANKDGSSGTDKSGKSGGKGGS